MNPNPPVDSSNPDDKRPIRKIDQAFEEVARLSGTDTPPANFFQEFLERTLLGIDAPAGAIWIKNVQGFLQLQCQVNIDHVGLDRHKNGRQSHNELLRQAFQTAKPILLEPFGSTGILEGIPAGNPTDFVVLLAPILLDEKTPVGLVEVWQEPRWDARVKRIHLNYLVQMAGYASNYVRNQQGRQSVNHEQLWNQLEAFSCQIHASLDPTIVSYHVANEGRRLIGCDRLSVAIREAKKAKIEAVSGADVVEKRSSQIQLMRKLSDAVLKWNEKLVYRGAKDDGLPPDVYNALDEYLAQSPAKLLVFLPLHDNREIDKESKEYKPGLCRSGLLMECFEPPAQPEPLMARLDVIGRHSASALYNAVEIRKIPLAWIWKPILKVQEGLGGRAKFLTYLISTIVVLVLLGLIVIPYELKMDGKGHMLPVERVPVYSPRAGYVDKIMVKRGDTFGRRQVMVVMKDNELAHQINTATGKVIAAQNKLEQYQQVLTRTLAPAERDRTEQERIVALAELNAAQSDLDLLTRSYNALLNEPGAFQLMSPEFSPNIKREHDPKWRVINGNDFQNELLGRFVKPSDQILQLGEVEGAWEVEIRIPEKHMGQVRAAYKTDRPDETLDVELKLQNYPTATFRGKLPQSKIAPAAVPNRDDHNETEPVVYAYVRISGDDIPEEDRVPRHLYLTGGEVKANIRCGKHSMGYSLFYGLWEFLHQKWFQFF